MPNILKRFMNPTASPYEYEQAEQLVVERPIPPSQEQVEEQTPTRAPNPEARAPVDYAKLQAQAIMADAHQQATELIERTMAQLEPELEQLRMAARQEGHQEGYTAGLAAGMTQADDHLKAHTDQLAQKVAVFLEKATLAQTEMLEQTQEELRDLAIAVAEKIVRVSLKSSGDIIARMIQGATEKLKRKEWVHIYIAGCDSKKMAQVTPGLTRSLSALSDHVKIVPMADDESGTCIIEMPDEIIDASASTQLSNIRELLAQGNSAQG